MAGKDRKKQLARQRFERQQQRRAAQAARKRRIRVAGSAAAVVVVVGGGVGIATVAGGDDGAKDAKSTPPPKTPPPSATAKPGECAYQPAQEPGAKNVGNPPVKPAYMGTTDATIKTNLGAIKVELDGKKAPCTVNSFGYLAQKSFFDKTKCHRLTSKGIKVLQCGDPTGQGAGGPAYRFANEGTGNPQQMKTYPKGTVAMAHSQQPNSNGSQFFVVYGDSSLPDDYTIFGKIASGMDIVEKVAKAGSEPKDDGAPKKSVTIQDVAIAKK